MNYEKEMEEWDEKSELEYGTSGNYEDEDDSSFDDYLKIQVSVSQLITKK
jgi:hypothetical protein